MSTTSTPARARGRVTTRTLWRDRWWLQPVLTQFGLLAFVIHRWPVAGVLPPSAALPLHHRSEVLLMASKPAPNG